MIIKPAHPDELSDLVALINSAYRGEASRAGWTTEADLLDGQLRTDLDRLQKQLAEPGATMLIYNDDSSGILGCVYLKKDQQKLYLGMLTVSPQKQAKGIGKELLIAAEEFARENDCSSIYMRVINLRRELIEWYQRRGYVITGEKSPFPSDPVFGIPRRELEFLVMEKKL